MPFRPHRPPPRRVHRKIRFRNQLFQQPARLIENGRTSAEQDGFDPFPVVKLFTPDVAATWLITEAYPEGSDVRLFGLCDLGVGSPELGYAMLSEIEDARGKLGLPVERDLYFKTEHRLSNYAKIARHAGMIVT